MSFWNLQFSTKGTKKTTLLLWYLKSNYIRFLVGRIENTKKTFRNQLTFSVVAMNTYIPVFVFTMGRNNSSEVDFFRSFYRRIEDTKNKF